LEKADPGNYNPRMSPTLETPLDRLLDPVARCFTTDVAKRLADIRPDPGTQARIDELAGKATEGKLTVAEEAEYHGYVEAIDIVSILQAKARRLLTSRDV
jgi:hypothetical protein